MSKIVERAKAKLEVAAGAVTETVGRVVGNEKMEAEGAAHQVIGNARNAKAKAAEHTKGVVEEVIGTVKNKVGRVVGDDSLAAEGKIEEIKGKARQTLNE